MKRIHTPLKRLLFERSMTQRELAEGTGISEGAICHAVNGVASSEVMRKVAEFLYVDKEYIF